jgi:hypothetical protein
VTGSDRDLTEGLSRHFSDQTKENMKYLSQYGRSAYRFLKEGPPKTKEKSDGLSLEMFYGNVLRHRLMHKLRCDAQLIICLVF